jgi:DNA invertase Pin-like site-specific DNA recombinase
VGRNATVVIIGRRRWLMVTRLDRLARSTRDRLNALAAITRKKAGFKSLGDTWADTTTSHGRLMLTVLGGLAEFERDLIRARTGEGRARAVARGQRMGRPPKLTPHQRCEAIKRRDSGDESVADIGRSYNVSAATISARLGHDNDNTKCTRGEDFPVVSPSMV